MGPNGLKKIVPAENVTDNTTVDIIAIHGLDTESPRTWVFDKRDGSPTVNWLQDSDMLPAAVPSARIYTYDWNAKVFDNAPVQTLLGHADYLLGLVAAERGTSDRPIIFIASCFGGLVLAEAICRAAQEGSKYRQILRSTVGIVFLATPFFGTDAARPASWLVVVKGIMGKDASDQLIKDLEARHDFVRERVQKFAEIANSNAIRLPIRCFYETKKTKIAKKILPTWISDRWSRGSILVTESSACLHGFECRGLGKTHVMMNKFEGNDCPDFKQVKEAIQFILEEAPNTLKRREKDAKKPHFMVPFGRNENFVGRESILQQLLGRIPPDANQDDCQRTVLEGLGGIGKTQIALEAAYRVRDKHPDCSVFWVPAVDATSFENAYRDIARELGVKGIEDDKADVRMLVKAALSHDSAGSWLMIADNADDMKLVTSLSEYLPFNRKGSILFTTRNHSVVSSLDISPKGLMNIGQMSREESFEMLKKYVKQESQWHDIKSTTELLDLLTDFPLAIRQASAYMSENGISTTKYLHYCRSSDKDMVELLSENFQDRGRYDASKNPVAMTWLISFEHISQSRPLAAQYLRFICFLAEKDIPISLLLPERSKREIDKAIDKRTVARMGDKGISTAY
ncbi:P-loop containing nucleoside triphosphate hydrolase protein [Rostrohypoxylon terebratum]|nr:P-loop containing nucleoside triphosphate hydrolase protein [Rostrohypoxylon terebratum]